MMGALHVTYGRLRLSFRLVTQSFLIDDTMGKEHVTIANPKEVCVASRPSTVFPDTINLLLSVQIRFISKQILMIQNDVSMSLGA